MPSHERGHHEQPSGYGGHFTPASSGDGPSREAPPPDPPLAIDAEMQRIPETAEQLPVSEPTVATAIGQLERIGILRELTGRPRNKIFAYDEYLRS